MIETSFGLISAIAADVLVLSTKRMEEIDAARAEIDDRKVRKTIEKLSRPLLFGLISRRPRSYLEAVAYLKQGAYWGRWGSRKYTGSEDRLYKAHILAKAAISNGEHMIYLNEWLCESLYETEYKADD